MRSRILRKGKSEFIQFVQLRRPLYGIELQAIFDTFSILYKFSNISDAILILMCGKSLALTLYNY